MSEIISLDYLAPCPCGNPEALWRNVQRSLLTTVSVYCTTCTPAEDAA